MLLCAAPLVAQHTETRDMGGGNKIELHYDAAGTVVETDTIGADGKLLEKNVLEHPPGALTAQKVNTSYWPNGQVHQVARNTYDNNTNFLGEFIQVFDESGKQIGGHKLTHDPQTNIYTCAAWNTAAQNYKAEECPAGEEGPGTPETVKKFTADEVMQQLMRARQAAAQAPRSAAAAVASPPAEAGTGVKEVGLVLPAHMRPGDRVSGSVVENPSNYAGMPDVMVARVAIPFAASGSASSLAGWQLEMPGLAPQPANGPIALTVPRDQSELAIVFRQADNTGVSVLNVIPLPAPSGRKEVSARKSNVPPTYRAPAICIKGQLCVVEGPFDGDSSKTFAAVEERPAKIVAETVDAAYLAIPAATEAGARPLAIAEGAYAIAFPMVVAKFGTRPDQRDLPKGETQLMYATIEGPADLPGAEWRPGNFPASNLEQVRRVIPGFNPAGNSAKEKHEKRMKGDGGGEENEGGELLLVVKNLTPDVANFRESKNGVYLFHLNEAAFKMGEFKYKFVVEATKTGSFGVQSYLVPFLAPVKGQVFPMSAAAGAK